MSGYQSFEVADPQESLAKLAGLVLQGMELEDFRVAAVTLVKSCLRIRGGSGADKDTMGQSLCELEAIFNGITDGDRRIDWLREGVAYIADPAVFDLFHTPGRIVALCRNGACAFDCLPVDTLVLAAGYKLKPIGEVHVGDLIMGDGGWTRVLSVMQKGVKDTIRFGLNNGSALRCTTEHRLFRVPKRKGYAGDRDQAEEVRADQIALDDDLLTPRTLPVGTESLPEDKAWLLGVFIADGWIGHSEKDGRPINFCIAGRDGHPKEAQKARVAQIADKYGWHHHTDSKEIVVSDEGAATWLAAAGRGAINKHVPSLNFDEPTLRHILSGLAADASVTNCTVYGTISPELALQNRIMHRMLGRSTHITRVDEHGGFGRNPIYRITARAAGDKRRPYSRVKSIEAAGEAETVDLMVEGGRFYLPESDTVVHNCDDHTVITAALAGCVGFKVGLRAWGKSANELSHVYAVARVPKVRTRKTLALDTSTGNPRIGWQPPGGVFLTCWIEENGSLTWQSSDHEEGDDQ